MNLQGNKEFICRQSCVDRSFHIDNLYLIMGTLSRVRENVDRTDKYSKFVVSMGHRYCPKCFLDTTPQIYSIAFTTEQRYLEVVVKT